MKVVSLGFFVVKVCVLMYVKTKRQKTSKEDSMTTPKAAAKGESFAARAAPKKAAKVASTSRGASKRTAKATSSTTSETTSKAKRTPKEASEMMSKAAAIRNCKAMKA